MSEANAMSNFLTNQVGGIYKTWLQNDFSEMRGGLVYSKDILSVGLVKDHVEWGDNYSGSNIFSARNPSFTMLKLNLSPISWMDFNYFHGWLVSEVIDSNNAYIMDNGAFKYFNRPKNISSNFFTFKIFKKLNFSLGNSIIYSDLGMFNPTYLIPVFFYKSVDHTLNSNVENQNSQLFFNLSSRNIKHIHFYSSFYIDEFQKNRFLNDTLFNFISFKAGVKINNLFLDNISIIFEFTKTNPFTYKHHIDVTTFESNNYNLGHYLRDNSREAYFLLAYKPTEKINMKLEYLNAVKGPDYMYSFSEDYVPGEVGFLEDIIWRNSSLKLSFIYEFYNNISFTFSYLNNNLFNNTSDATILALYSSEFNINNSNIFSFTLNINK